jgi:hypothetical protein
MKQLPRFLSILAGILALCASAAILQTWAADKPVAPTKAAAASPAAMAPGPTGVSRLTPPGSPQVPEESASVRDDPTIAPDPKQSADNNVSFPSDI